uniref:Uncharacterized protein n=1 Tax=Curvibacter symbiont subsp. Hydra magnipapillata TaxID=667019 RepID=C9YDF9_CURXX|nr:hypothetical protein Csp_C27380 [Curvibacter putative symbiont of Hydra magnipapillata]
MLAQWVSGREPNSRKVGQLTAAPSTQPASTSLTLCAFTITREMPTAKASAQPMAAPAPLACMAGQGTPRSNNGKMLVANRVCPLMPVKSSAAMPMPQPKNRHLLMTVIVTASTMRIR